ncbi:MAG: hypothetical protein Q8P50_15565 [Bacillota bacterium]|nr:hypothetical protein [Bacillota bacterium]
MSSDPWIWIQAFVVISIMSFLWKDNPVFAISQNFYVGAAAAHGAILALQNFRSLGWVPLVSQGKNVTLIPIALGLLMLSRFSKKHAYLSRIALAVPIGIGSGIALKAIPAAQVLGQVRATISNLGSIDGWIILVGTITTITFFLFTTRQTQLVRTGYNVGLFFMCVTFGVTFATGVMTYISVFYGPANAVFSLWLGLYK